MCQFLAIIKTSNASASGSIIFKSGNPIPRSHFDTALSVTFNLFASSSCVQPFHTFDIVIAVFELSQNIVHQSAGVINGNTVLDFNAIIGDLTEQLENMEVGELFLLLIETSSVVYITLFMECMGNNVCQDIGIHTKKDSLPKKQIVLFMFI